MNAAIIIDDREDVAQEAMDRHKRFIPKSWDLLHIQPPYAGGIYYIKTPRVYNSILTNPNFWQGSRVWTGC